MIRVAVSNRQLMTKNFTFQRHFKIQNAFSGTEIGGAKILSVQFISD